MAYLMAILIAAVIPWNHVLQSYVRGPGNRWRRKAGVMAIGCLSDAELKADER